ncbi:MAG: FkbM family methyltransferase [Litoreibacter sp.]
MNLDTANVIATYHNIEVLQGEHLGPQMIRNMGNDRYEHQEIRAALLEIAPDDVVVEMGAGSGVVGAIIAKNCKPKRILSFEANHKLIDHIKRLYVHNNIADRIEVRNQIVLSQTRAPEDVEFFIRGNFLGSGMVITKGMDRAEKVSVPVVKWQEIKKEVSPTVLMMDIEGAEHDFFRDADLSGIRTIIVELHRDVYHRKGMRQIREKMLVEKGFTEDTEASRGGVFVFRRA